MSKTFRRWEVDQSQLFPPSVRDLVPAGHLAHFVRDLVCEEVDLAPILATYTEERGAPPYHPVMMTALLLYGYCRGIYSSRRLEQACEERVDFMAVTGMAKPDHSRISEFRRRHREALRGLFVQVLRLCQTAGLTTLGHVALDGTKMPANASRHAAMSYERMCTAEPALAAEVDRWLQEADATDTQEDEQHGRGRRGDELPPWVQTKARRLENIRAAKARLEAAAKAAEQAAPAAKAQSNFTDPESRILKTRNGFQQGYNCQAAVDAASQVIVAEAVGAQQNDVEQLVPVVEAIRANLGTTPAEVSADAGYLSAANLCALARRRIRGYVAVGRQRHGTAGPTSLAERWTGTWVRRMLTRLRRGGWRSRYRLRKQTVEPVFGQIKSARGFRQFLLRGLANVRLEWSLLCTAHNVLKLAAAR
jgi:transposase